MNRRLVFTAYNRPCYFTPVMASWAQARGFGDWNPTVYLEPSSQRPTMAAIAGNHGATVVVNPHRLGVLHNPWNALNTAFSNGADFVVLAEDDVLVSDDVLEFLRWASVRFKTQHVLAACACSQEPTSSPTQANHVTIHRRFNALVWGTWRDRWDNVLRDTWDHDYSSGTPDAPQSGWDWNINLRVMADWYIASPVASRSQHIGEFGGIHMQPAAFPESTSPTFRQHRPRAPFTLVPNR
jgi:hypothetical protein